MDDALDDELRRRRRGQLVGVAFLLVVVIVAVVIGSGALSGDDPAKDASVVDGVKGTKETTKLLSGVPQNGLVLGDPNAPATVVEFIDVKCPVCKSYELKDGPDVVKDLVRTGKANLELRVIGVIGVDEPNPDTYVGRTAVHSLAAENRAWDLAQLLYFNQKDESQRWVTPAILKRIGSVAPELKGLPIATSPTPATKRLDAETEALRKRLDVNATPTIFVRPRGATDTGSYRKVSLKGTGSKADKIESAVGDLSR